MVLRLDDTDVERNTEASVQSIFEGLRWLGLSWDEECKQSERLALHRRQAEAIFAKGLAYRDFTPAHSGDDNQSSAQGAWLFNPGMRELSREASDRRAASGEPFALRYRVPRGQARTLRFIDSVYGEQQKLADEVEDFALLRSDGMPTYHLASCVDDADLRISHIIRGQDHLTNTFKHLALFEALGAQSPQFAHLPLLVAPDGTKLSKRKHGPVVSVTTYRDAGFLSCWAGRQRTTASSSPSSSSKRHSLSRPSTAPTLSSISATRILSILRLSGSMPSISAPCPLNSSAPAFSLSSSRLDSIPRPKSSSPSLRSFASASNSCAMLFQQPISSSCPNSPPTTQPT